MKKLFLFIAAALVSTGMWADTYVLDNTGDTKDDTSNPKTHVWTVSDQTFTLSPQHAGDGTGNFFKLSSGKTYTLTLPDGFAVTNVNIKGYTNKDGKTDGEIKEFNSVAQTNKNFPAKNDGNLANQPAYKDGYDFAVSQTGGSITIKTGSGNQIGAIITITGTPPACTSPTIAWVTEPANGEVGDDDFTASVTTTPAEQTITWTSSVTNVATISNGTIHYVAPGVTTISASFTYSGEDYCNKTVTVSKNINVPISYDTPGENDKVWYYQSAVPASSPDNGLTYSGTISGSGLYGVKLDSKGFAWFVKPAVAGTLRIGAYSTDVQVAYEVYAYACDAEGTKSGDALGTLTTPHAGGVSNSIDVAANVTGIRFERKTSNQGTLYFIEFRGEAPCAATAPGDISKGTLSEGNLTLTAAGSPVEGDTWYWQSAADGEDKTGTSGASKVVSAAGTYYIRSYNAAADCWSAAKSFTVTAIDLVANYTVIYLDGETELGRETVEVGETPAGIEDPEKECYTFAGWNPTLASIASTAEQDDEIEVTAQWTPIYASSFNFGTTTDLTKDNIKTKLNAVGIACKVGAGGSYDAGGTTGYLGYKFKNNGDYIAFIVENGKEAIITYGYTESGWTVNGVDAGVTTGQKKYVDKTYQASGSDLLLKLVNQSVDGKTSTLSNIVIQKSTTTALDNAEEGAKAVKFIENGQMYIQKDGKIYNVMGMEIR